MEIQTETQTLEHKILGPDNFADNVPEFEKWDSIAEIQARVGNPPDGLEPEISTEKYARTMVLWK